MKNAMKRWLSLLLTVLMVVAAMPFAALAEGALTEPVETGDGLIEETLTPVEPETPTEPVVNVSNAVTAVNLLATGEDRADSVDESAVDARASDQEAGIYYLKSPTSDPDANSSNAFGNEITKATVNMTGANWVDGNGWFSKKDQNVFDNLKTHVISMADGMKEQEDGSWLMPKAQYSSHYQAIFNTYKSELQNELGTTLNSWNDIEAIYLKPHKISRYNNNGTTTSYTGDKRIHVDCTISVKTEAFYQAKFFVTKPGEVEKQVDAANYKASEPVQKTTNAPTADSGSYPQQLTVDGITYEFDGWYNEAGEKVTSWAYTPNEAELSDGTVNFYAYYTPTTATVTVTKTVNTTVGKDADRAFDFNYTVNDEAGEPFALKNGESKVLTVPIGANVVVSEAVDAEFATAYAIDDSTPIAGLSAAIENVNANGHTVAFINTRSVELSGVVNPDTAQMRVSKTFVGIDSSWIPEDFTVYVGETPLKWKDAATSDDRLTGTWIMEGNAGTYNVTESELLFENYEHTSTGTGSYTVESDEISITQNQYIQQCSNQDFTVGVTGNSDFVFAAALKGRAVVISAKPITSAIVRDAINEKIEAYSGDWRSPARFYSVDDFPEGLLELETGEVLTYKGGNIIHIGEKSDWTKVAMLSYDVKYANVPDIEVTNNYILKVTNVTIGKVVDGNMGDWKKDFTFNVSYKVGEETTNLDSFTLKHNEKKVLSEIPIGATITVTETDTTYKEAWVAGVFEDSGMNASQLKDAISGSDTAGQTATATVAATGTTIIFTNTNEATVDTGILLDSLPYVVILAVVGAALVLWFIRKRRNDD